MPVTIYKIQNVKGLVYIGSTKHSLRKRLCEHYSDMSRWESGRYHWVASFAVLEYEHYIETLEVLDDATYRLQREQYHIDMYKLLPDIKVTNVYRPAPDSPCPSFQPATCKYCGFTFTKHNNLAPHIQKRHPEAATVIRPYYQSVACNICGVVCSTAYVLKRHLKNIHAVSSGGSEPAASVEENGHNGSGTLCHVLPGG